MQAIDDLHRFEVCRRYVSNVGGLELKRGIAAVVRSGWKQISAAKRAGILVPIFFSILLVAFFFNVTRPSKNAGGSFALGCDSFGYQRGAELFRKNGLIKGFDTAIDNPDAVFLIETAKTIGLPLDRWYQMIAPHCHHYKSGSEKIILQYPPGTSLLMAQFPRGMAGQGTYTYTIGLIAVAVALMCFYFSPNYWRIVLLGGLVYGLFRLLKVPTTFASYSVPWSIALVPITVVIALIIPRISGRLQLSAASAMGVLCGVLFLVRLPNVFLIAGLGIFVVLECKLWSFLALKRHGAAIFVAGLVFGVFGILTLALYNLVNTGDFLQSTYAAYDTNPPVYSWSLVKSNAIYYFYVTETAFYTSFSVLFFIIYLVRIFFFNCPRVVAHAVLSAAFVSISTIFYFLTHDITVPYYILPSSVLVVTLLVFAEAGTGIDLRGREPRSRSLLPAILVGSVVLLAIQTPKRSGPAPFPMRIAEEVVASNAIVWSDILSGTFYYYTGKYSAKLSYTDLCAQHNLVQAVADRGRTQFIIIDSDQIQATADHLRSFADLVPIGVFEVYRPMPVFRIDNIRRVAPPCKG